MPVRFSCSAWTDSGAKNASLYTYIYIYRNSAPAIQLGGLAQLANW